MDHTLTGNNNKIRGSSQTPALLMDREAVVSPPWHCLLNFLYLPTNLSHFLCPTLTLSPSHTFCHGKTWVSISIFHALVPNVCSHSSALWEFCWKLAVFGTSTLPLAPHSDCFRENIYAGDRSAQTKDIC